MWLELSNPAIIVLNVTSILATHLGLSWAFTRMPARCFDPASSWFTIRPWENDGAFWQRALGVRRWKRHLPDAAPWFRGFAKKNLRSREPDFLRRFVIETCRGEAAHLAQAVVLLLPLLWNPWPAAAVIVVYAVASNLPCIAVQRQTRARLQGLLGRLG